jgi:hypothetical protein
MRRAAVIALAVLAAPVLSGAAGYQFARHADAESWAEISWPFPRDGWPAGRAFRCQGAACGEGIELYVRPKLGFCNCDSGVADDDEVDRVADLDLISPRFAPTAPGREVRLNELTGRARNYELAMEGRIHAAVGFALSRRCDLLVAVAQGKAARPQLEQAATRFLERQEIRSWTLAALDQRAAIPH